MTGKISQLLQNTPPPHTHTHTIILRKAVNGRIKPDGREKRRGRWRKEKKKLESEDKEQEYQNKRILKIKRRTETRCRTGRREWRRIKTRRGR
jgi:hypothetical protein